MIYDWRDEKFNQFKRSGGKVRFEFAACASLNHFRQTSRRKDRQFLCCQRTEFETCRRPTGRPAKQAVNKNGEKKPFKTIFDIEAKLAETLAGSLDSGLGDLSTNKKYMEGFGTKEGEKRALLKRNENNR